MARVFFETFHATAQKALSDYSALKLLPILLLNCHILIEIAGK